MPGVFDQQTMVRLADGSLMTVHAAGNAVIVSTDRGQTWSEPRPIHDRTAPNRATRGPLIRTRDGALLLLYQRMSGVKERWSEAERDWTPQFSSELWIWTRYGSPPPLCVGLREEELVRGLR